MKIKVIQILKTKQKKKVEVKVNLKTILKIV